MTNTERKKYQKQLKKLRRNRTECCRLATFWGIGYIVSLAALCGSYVFDTQKDTKDQLFAVNTGMFAGTVGFSAMTAIRRRQINRIRDEMQKKK